MGQVDRLGRQLSRRVCSVAGHGRPFEGFLRAVRLVAANWHGKYYYDWALTEAVAKRRAKHLRLSMNFDNAQAVIVRLLRF